MATQTLGQFIKALEELRATHGDEIAIWVQDADTDWLLEPGVRVGPNEYSDETPPPNVVLITSHYYGND